MPVERNRNRNRFLASLPHADLTRWAPRLEMVDLPLGQVMHGPGNGSGDVYFPLSALVSLSSGSPAGESTGVALVGNDGVLGGAQFLGGGNATSPGFVIVPGIAYRLRPVHGHDELERGSAVLGLMLRYVQALTTQIAQTALCASLHTLDQQLCRWLLICIDRLPSDDLAMSSTTLAKLLRHRRAGLVEAVQRLQAEGLIDCCGGRLSVLDRTRLAQRACGCSAVVKEELDRLLPWPASVQ